MRTTALLLLLFICLRGAAQLKRTAVPTLPAKGVALKSFIPEGWKLLDSASGDLNKDGRRDIAFILESKDSLVDYRYGLEEDSPVLVMAKPRVLAIVFRATDGYTLNLQENDFVLRSDEGGCMGDPWNGVEIDKGSLFLMFWGGCSDKWNLSYQFAYRSGQWQLIGATSVDYNNDKSGEIWSYNFLTGKAKQTILNADERVKDIVKWHALRDRTLRTFETFERPFTWQLFPNVFL